jgi:hypothetical protein
MFLGGMAPVVGINQVASLKTLHLLTSAPLDR